MKVELLEVYGSDLTIVNAARVSFGKFKKSFTDSDVKLINYLKTHRHTSPFRHAFLQFRIECPIFVERQLFKHQIGLSANCLHGDSEITFVTSSGKLEKETIESLYNRWNSGRTLKTSKKDIEYCRKRISNKKLRVLNEESGEFETGKIKNIFKSGVKKLFKITTQSGHSLKVSGDHRIYTDSGWMTLNTGLTTKNFIGLNGKQFAGNGQYLDYATVKQDRETGLSVQEMAKHSKQTEVLDKTKFGENNVNRRGKRLKVHFSKISSIKCIGYHDTFDIEVEGPHHNFVANNCVVHNSISGRYVDFSDKYHKVDHLRLQSVDSKQGSSGSLDRIDLVDKMNKMIEDCSSLYEELCSAGVAKEQARIILPLALETTFIWSGSLLAFCHLWDLRLKPDAQQETREVAQKMLDEVKNLKDNPFKHSLEAFGF